MSTSLLDRWRSILRSLSMWRWSTRARRRLLLAGGLDIGGATIHHGVYFGGPDVSIGDRTFLNTGCFIDNAAPVRIGSDCAIGMRVLIVTSFHELGGHDRRALNPSQGNPVEIGDGCWIGAGAVILPGVTIAPGSVIGAGAVVTKDTEPDFLYAGNPAVPLRRLD